MERRVRARDAWAAGLSGGVVLLIALACAPPPNAGQTGVVVNGRTSGGSNAACDGANVSENGCVGVRFDEFRQQTIVEAWFRVPGVTLNGMRVALIGIPTGAGGDTDTTWSLQTASSGWRYLECHSLDFLIDGRSVTVRRPEHHGEVGSGGSVAEYVRFDASREMMIAITRAGSFRGRLCGDTFSLTAEQLATLRAYLREFDRAHATDRPVARDDAAESSEDATATHDAGDAGVTGDGTAWWQR